MSLRHPVHMRRDVFIREICCYTLLFSFGPKQNQKSVSHTWMGHVSHMNEMRLTYTKHAHRSADLLIDHCNTLQHTATHCNTLRYIQTQTHVSADCWQSSFVLLQLTKHARRSADTWIWQSKPNLWDSTIFPQKSPRSSRNSPMSPQKSPIIE